MPGLELEDIVEGNFIISNYNKLQKKSIAMIKNVVLVDSRNKRCDIFFPETDEVHNINVHSGVSAEAKLVSQEEAEMFLEETLHKNNETILSLKKRNLSIRKAFKTAFENAPAI